MDFFFFLIIKIHFLRKRLQDEVCLASTVEKRNTATERLSATYLRMYEFEVFYLYTAKYSLYNIPHPFRLLCTKILHSMDL